MKLTDRIRPGSEAAPWVVSEVAKLEKRIELDEALLRQALDCLENHVLQRTYAGGVVIANTAIALRERLKETT
jgi:hypothetical protein